VCVCVHVCMFVLLGGIRRSLQTGRGTYLKQQACHGDYLKWKLWQLKSVTIRRIFVCVCIGMSVSECVLCIGYFEILFIGWAGLGSVFAFQMFSCG